MGRTGWRPSRSPREARHYYGQPAAAVRDRQECYAGPPSDPDAYLTGYARAGAAHLILRFAGEHEQHLETVAAVRARF